MSKETTLKTDLKELVDIAYIGSVTVRPRKNVLTDEYTLTGANLAHDAFEAHALKALLAAKDKELKAALERVKVLEGIVQNALHTIKSHGFITPEIRHKMEEAVPGLETKALKGGKDDD